MPKNSLLPKICPAFFTVEQKTPKSVITKVSAAIKLKDKQTQHLSDRQFDRHCSVSTTFYKDPNTKLRESSPWGIKLEKLFFEVLLIASNQWQNFLHSI